MCVHACVCVCVGVRASGGGEGVAHGLQYKVHSKIKLFIYKDHESDVADGVFNSVSRDPSANLIRHYLRSRRCSFKLN